jgi:glycine cleavage system aminomethyltransferase T
VRLGKGDFIGRDALVRLKAEGVTRRLATVTIDPAATIYGGEAVWREGRLLGRLRSGGYGYTVGRNIGFVYLPRELAQATGTPLEVEVFGERVAAEIAPDVLYDPQGARIRA